jgi:hypothetical protein
MNYFVTTQMQTLNFPAQWGIATAISIQVTGPSDDLVVYGLTLYALVG